MGWVGGRWCRGTGRKSRDHRGKPNSQKGGKRRGGQTNAKKAHRTTATAPRRELAKGRCVRPVGVGVWVCLWFRMGGRQAKDVAALAAKEMQESMLLPSSQTSTAATTAPPPSPTPPPAQAQALCCPLPALTLGLVDLGHKPSAFQCCSLKQTSYLPRLLHAGGAPSLSTHPHLPRIRHLFPFIYLKPAAGRGRCTQFFATRRTAATIITSSLPSSPLHARHTTTV